MGRPCGPGADCDDDNVQISGAFFVLLIVLVSIVYGDIYIYSSVESIVIGGGRKMWGGAWL